MRSLIASVLVGIALSAAAPVWAHHSFAAEFDDKQIVKLHGTVVKMEWVNPHAWIHVAVANPDGTTTEWMIEGNTPNGLLRRGFTKKSLEPGTEVYVEGYRAKSGDYKANGSSITFKDGKKLFLGSSHDEQQATQK
ncbi:MAG TPA: DUF6152 family protein [Bryobacteraceae bacterium]|nr:DUF6152 family protein [Bryobacteraceae bacterium]